MSVKVFLYCAAVACCTVYLFIVRLMLDCRHFVRLVVDLVYLLKWWIC